MQRQFGRFAALLVVLGAALMPLLLASSANAATSCPAWAGGGSASLQQAVDAYSCVTVRPGTWHLTGHVVIPAGHVLTGIAGRARSTTLYADPSSAWGCCSGMLDVDPKHSLSTANVSVRYLTLQAAHQAVLGIGGGEFSVSHVWVANTVCNGLSVYGPRVTVDSSTFVGNGYGASCPNAPPGAAIYVHPVGGDPFAGPVVTNSTFTGNGTPIDVDSVDGGRVTHNTFTGSDGWASIALYRASTWTVSNNVIRHPTSGSLGDRPGGNYSYQTGCQVGPTGGHPAAIWLCENYDSDGHRADHNTITGNAVSSYYGILLMGLDDPAENGSPGLVPSANTLSGNVITGTTTPAADDNGPTTTTDPTAPAAATNPNSWTSNTCAGQPCQPVYF